MAYAVRVHEASHALYPGTCFITVGRASRSGPSKACIPEDSTPYAVEVNEINGTLNVWAAKIPQWPVRVWNSAKILKHGAWLH